MNHKLSISLRWLALLFLLYGGCKEITIENQQDEIALKQIQGSRISLVGNITLERPKTGLTLGMVTSIAILEDHIIILDHMRKIVEIFDKGGNYKWSIGSRGDGEGQYKIPSGLAVIPNTNQILIHDQGRKKQTLRFSIKGEFLEKLKQPDRRLMRLLVSEDHNLIHTYVDRNRNGMLCVTSLDTGEDLATFKVCEAQYGRHFSAFRRLQGLDYDEAKKIIYFVLPWEEKVVRIDLAAQEFLTPITINHPKFINLKLDDSKTENGSSKRPNFGNFSKLYGMCLLSSGNILLRYMFDDLSSSTALILLSDLSVEPSVQEVNNELGRDIFTCQGRLVYKYSPPSDNEDTNGNIRVYRLIDAPTNPTK